VSDEALGPHHEPFSQLHPGTALLLVIITTSLSAAVGVAIVAGLVSLAFPEFGAGLNTVLGAGVEASVAEGESAGAGVWAFWVVTGLGLAGTLYAFIRPVVKGGGADG